MERGQGREDYDTMPHFNECCHPLRWRKAECVVMVSRSADSEKWEQQLRGQNWISREHTGHLQMVCARLWRGRAAEWWMDVQERVWA
jgi:hypothetical protein